MYKTASVECNSISGMQQHQWNVEYDRNNRAKDRTIRTPSTTGLMSTPTSLYHFGCYIFNMNEYNTTLIQLGT